ncbi:MAG: hypothetical protein K0U98_00355 [Deltaproteobacteria bacterium]|nr:hypothetical protein [Deltaproteobacteria bacterium]
MWKKLILAGVVGWLATLGAWPTTAQMLGRVGNIQVDDTVCGMGDLNLDQAYTCVQVTVRCLGLDGLPIENRPVQLRITTPPEGTPILGTVVFGLGGTGRVFFENSQRPNDPALPSADMLNELNLAGFRVIQRAWPDPGPFEAGGWVNGSTSLQASACRYATLLDWIYQQPELHDPSSQAFCAVGQSGGGSEIGYALETYGLGNLIDMAVFTGGPPHGVIDGSCDPADTAWQQTCNAHLENLGICPQDGPDGHTCLFPPQNVANNVDAAFELNPFPNDMPCALADAPTLQANGILSPLAVPNYPNTHVAFLVGRDDCTSSSATGSPYIQAVLDHSTGPTSFATLLGVSHELPAFETGADAIGAALLASNGCIRRH